MNQEINAVARTPLRDGLLSGPLENLEEVHLTGTHCQGCGEVSLGKAELCPNCGRDAVSPISLAKSGTLWSYTIIRHRPPGDYMGKEPFEPFGLGLIELSDGLRVLSPIEGDIASLKIGMRLEFKAYARPAQAGERVLFTFAPL